MLLLAAPLKTDLELDLDQIIQNVYDNNEWRLHPIGHINDVAKRRAIQRGEKIIDEIKENVTTTFFAYNHLKNGVSPKKVAQKFQLPYQTIIKWKHANDIPNDLREYRTSYLSKENLNSLIFSTGVFARSLTSSHVPRTIERTIHFSLRRNKFAESLSNLTGKQITTKTNKVRHTNELLANTFNHVLHNVFDEYVKTKHQKREFLKGFVSPSRVNVKQNNHRWGYVISSSYSLPLETALSCFFDLGIYPYFQPSGERIEVFGYHNLKGMFDNALFANPHNNKIFRKFILQPNEPPDTINNYYKARELVSNIYANKQKPNWREIGASFTPPIPPATLVTWSGDIAKQYTNLTTPHQMPPIVQNYEYLATLLNK
tara:strand:- start:52268 stop:53383 length:1116 start_codon:yes stop_codon:yes gene_type:complete